MNNSQLNHFSKVPVDIGIRRSLFQRDKRRLTTFSAGKLIPILCEEVLPGDSVSLELSALVRMATPIHPVMDNAFLDVHFYFVPNRLVWDHWKNFMGENTAAPWANTTTYTIPQITAPTSGGDGVLNSSQVGWAKGSVADHLGLPIKRSMSVSALPFRGYSLIWNTYYRDQNLMSPCNFSTGDAAVVGSNSGVARGSTSTTWSALYDWYINNGVYVNSSPLGAAPLPVCRLHDQFSSCLPSPQKGPTVTLPLGTVAPIRNSSTASAFSPAWYTAAGSTITAGNAYGLGTKGEDGATYANGSPTASSLTNQLTVKLEADLSAATSSSINQLRNAFMVQRFYERLARGGSRYFEMIRAFFDVTVPDSTVQIPEFLGGRRVPINITQVAQTSATDSTTTPQGNLGAYSLTTDKSDNLFTKSFTEHGYLFGLAMIRTERSYSQGIPRHFSKSVFTDFYVPTFANAPEQPVYTKELYATGVSSSDNSVFGYQEAWYEYRYAPSEVTGEFRPDYATSLDSYHYGDDYASAPSLSPGWIKEGDSHVNRTLAVQSHDQFLADFLCSMKWVRPMPVYSVPGLLDHH